MTDTNKKNFFKKLLTNKQTCDIINTERGREKLPKRKKEVSTMTIANKMREITNKVIKEKEAKEMERLNELYNTLLSKVEAEALKGNSSTVIRNQGFDNERIVEKFLADGFTVSSTKMRDNFVRW